MGTNQWFDWLHSYTCFHTTQTLHLSFLEASCYLDFPAFGLHNAFVLVVRVNSYSQTEGQWPQQLEQGHPKNSDPRKAWHPRLQIEEPLAFCRKSGQTLMSELQTWFTEAAQTHITLYCFSIVSKCRLDCIALHRFPEHLRATANQVQSNFTEDGTYFLLHSNFFQQVSSSPGFSCSIQRDVWWKEYNHPSRNHPT